MHDAGVWRQYRGGLRSSSSGLAIKHTCSVQATEMRVSARCGLKSPIQLFFQSEFLCQKKSESRPTFAPPSQCLPKATPSRLATARKSALSAVRTPAARKTRASVPTRAAKPLWPEPPRSAKRKPEPPERNLPRWFGFLFGSNFRGPPAAYILRRYCPPTSNSALVICPSEQTRTASISTPNTFLFSITACCNRLSCVGAALAWRL